MTKKKKLILFLVLFVFTCIVITFVYTHNLSLKNFLFSDVNSISIEVAPNLYELNEEQKNNIQKLLNVNSWTKFKLKSDYYPSDYHILINKKYVLSIGSYDEDYDVCLVSKYHQYAKANKIVDMLKCGTYKIPKNLISELEAFTIEIK